MEKFKVGDIIIATKANESKTQQTRVVGKKYQVRAIMYCYNCGRQLVNIGQHYFGFSNDVECVCKQTQPHHGLKWTDARHFIKDSDIEAAIESAIEEENYELAAALRDSVKQEVEEI